MKERLIYQDYKMEGREEGFEEGIAIGREEGLSIGREEGIAIGIKMSEEQAQARIKELEEQIELLKAEKV